MSDPYRIAALVLSIAFVAAAQAQFTDDFSDGDFTNNPTWSGDEDLFIVVEEQLRSNAGQLPTSTTYYLATPSEQAFGQWDFFLNLRFNPSGANYVDVFLTSDQQDLADAGSGYAVRIGETARHIVLNKWVGGAIADTLIASPDNVVNSSSSNPVRIKVTRDTNGDWRLFYDRGEQGIYMLAGTANDGDLTNSQWFGIRILQSTAVAPANSHYFDDFQVGPIVQDTVPPSILQAAIVDELHVDLLFDEPLDPGSAQDVDHYMLDPWNPVVLATLDAGNPALVHLQLNEPLQHLTTYTLTVDGVTDLDDNATENESVQFTFVTISQAQPGDVVMSELMADPSPPIGLPDAEYVEVFNTTDDRAFNLAGWKLYAGSTAGTLPSVNLLPGEYLILTRTTDAPLFEDLGPVVGVPSFPALVNAGDAMDLQDASGTRIDAVTYTSNWYGDPAKANGGWSLERKDPYTPCSDVQNWTASADPRGGTPGEVNSVFALLVDTVPPEVLTVYVIAEDQVDVLFNELMDEASLAAGDYVFSPALNVTERAIMDRKRVRLTLASPLQMGVLYEVEVTSVNDCSGNPIGGANRAAFALPEPLGPGDVVINEVLYDPRGTGSDFVELYNRSQKVVSLAGTQLANVAGGIVANHRLITDEPMLLLPGEYRAVAADVANVLMNYPLGHADRMIEAPLPSYPNKEGTVVFLDAQGTVLELFAYNDNMHFPLLKSVDGVSLERVDPDRPTDDPTNWHSAAEQVNFATPGYQNSQYAPAPEARGEMTIDPKIFSPDNDGYQDLLTISYRFDEPGFVGTVKVYDVAGREVQVLMNNELLGTSGAVSWDGMMNTNELARMGPYVVIMEAYDLAGNVEKFRETVVLAHRL